MVLEGVDEMKRALLVGINQYPSAPLQGCLNDVEDWHRLLTTEGKYHPDNTRVVCDDRATTQGIRDRMAWLKEGITGPGDEVFFSFSGHGSQVRDRGPLDELADYKDEIICPFDLDWNTKVITDDDIGDWLKSFPKGTRIIVILDCCHSGTGTREMRPPEEAVLSYSSRYIAPPIDIALRNEGLPKLKGVEISNRIGVGRGRRGNWRKAKANGKQKSWFWWKGCCQRKTKPSPFPPITIEDSSMNHVLISGCRSDQTSADALINGRYNGALSRYLIDTIKRMPGKPVQEIHPVARKVILDAGYAQESQLEGPDILLKSPLFT